MSTASFIERCIEAGMPLDMALKAARAFEAEVNVMEDLRRSKDRERQARSRANRAVSRDNAECHVTSVTSVTDEAAPPFPPSLSPTPPNTTPLNPPADKLGRAAGESADGFEFDEPPPKAKARSPDRRGTRLAPDWRPTPDDFQFALDAGLTPEETDHAAAEFRDYWCARSGRDAAKLDWSATWRNNVRRVVARQRPRMAGTAGAAGGGQRVTSFAGLVARRRGYA